MFLVLISHWCAHLKVLTCVHISSQECLALKTSMFCLNNRQPYSRAYKCCMYTCMFLVLVIDIIFAEIIHFIHVRAHTYCVRTEFGSLQRNMINYIVRVLNPSRYHRISFCWFIIFRKSIMFWSIYLKSLHSDVFYFSVSIKVDDYEHWQIAHVRATHSSHTQIPHCVCVLKYFKHKVTNHLLLSMLSAYSWTHRQLVQKTATTNCPSLSYRSFLFCPCVTYIRYLMVNVITIFW